MTKKNKTDKSTAKPLSNNAHPGGFHSKLQERMLNQIVENDPLKKKGIMKDQSKGYRK